MPASPIGPSFSAAQKCLMLSDWIARVGVITRLQRFHFYSEKAASFLRMSYNFASYFFELTLLVKVFAIWSFWFAPGLVKKATVLLYHK